MADRYSQNLEEDIVLKWANGRNICFLEIGSNDGQTLSNVHALALQGSYGVCIEPSPKAYAQLAGLYLHRDDIVCFKNALSDYNGKAKFYESDSIFKGEDKALVSTLNDADYNKWKRATTFEEIEVDVFDFKTFLELSPYKQFQFISLDAEGEDLKILSQMNLTELGCELLCIEHNGNKEVLKQIREYCAQFALTNELLFNGENILLSI